MARPTHAEPRDGETGMEKGGSASVQVENRHESSDLEASSKDTGKGTSHISKPRVVARAPGKEHMSNGLKSGDVQEGSTSLTKGTRPGVVPLCQYQIVTL